MNDLIKSFLYVGSRYDFRLQGPGGRSNSALLGVILAVFLIPGSCFAQEVRYVSDVLVITLRSGPGDQYRIIKTLKSGTQLQLLESQDEFVKVQVDGVGEGWVRLQYLQESPTAKTLLAKTESQLRQTKTALSGLQQESEELKQQHRKLKTDHEKLLIEAKQLRKDNIHLNQVAERPLEFEKQNQQLSSESARLKQENERLSKENGELRESTAQKWFMTGSAALLLGIIAGLVLPKMRGRQSSGMWR